jgi:hypothetical protein
MITFTAWLATRPYGEPVNLEVARMLEVAFTAGMRFGCESTPPLGPVPHQDAV